MWTGLVLITAKLVASRAAEDNLWIALKHVTGLTDRELSYFADELLTLQPPSQRDLWQRKVHCTLGTCGPEATSRLIAALGENEKLPSRAFELFPGDPLYQYWKESDRQKFHSWIDGEASEEETIEALIPEGQPLASGRIQAAHFTWKAKDLVLKLLGPAAGAFGALGRCLEWDTPFYTIKAFGPLCFRHDVLQYADPRAGHPEKMQTYSKGTRVMALDVLRPPDWMPTDYGLVVCFFVLEHVPDPHQAARGIAKLLNPGGYLLLGAPFIDGVHGCPDDFFRYTPHGLRKVAEGAKLEVLLEFSPGMTVAAAGDFIGMRSSYWRTEDLLKISDTHPMNVFLLARKPLMPHQRRTWARHNQTEWT
ncbi:hypothetical protein AK812_SmicGene30548 [Symbiodinium microadriaticum]|uniref:Methyltransferase type 11 domain-containing protein n=1 Tax=Symbiodinium microadriaticum TaxID=2951 RepID=A0A1Q9CZ05_SYMMI|nr:hypothetical protein AK812_SmicGene30548 [Symbiodinium microadriaticum]CAE7806899.1 unnamed protein product [Symbiodinium sp. KB8]